MLIVAACDRGATDLEELEEIHREITGLVDIDNHGRVLLTFRDSTTGLAAILEDGRLTLLPRPAAGMVMSHVAAMNEIGWVTGEIYRDSDRRQFPFLWRPGMPVLQLLVPSDGDAYRPEAINDQGVIAGISFLKDGQIDELNPYRVPFIWSEGRGFEKLLPPIAGSFRWSGATDINNSGQVVGWWNEDDGGIYISAFSWMPGNGFRKIEGVPGGGQTVPHAVNELGQVTGLNTDQGYRVFRWSYDEPMRVASEATYSCGYDINDEGEVVGEMLGPGGEVRVAYVWHPTGGITVIPTPSGRDARASRINNRGDVIGFWDQGTGNGVIVTHFLWSRARGLQVLGSVEYDYSSTRVTTRRTTGMSLPC